MPIAPAVNFLGVVPRFSEAIVKLQGPGDYVVVARGLPRAIVMSCPDGCGETLTINLDQRVGPAWRKYDKDGQLTVYPSVWRDSGCGAHFIVWKNRILWCGPSEEYSDVDADEVLLAKIMAMLPLKSYVHYEAIAEAVDANPWDAYWACKDLVRLGRAKQGRRGMFCATRA